MRDGRHILDELAGIRRRIRLAAGARGALLGLALIGTLTLFSLGVDRLFRLGVPARCVLMGLYALALGFFIWKFVLRPLRQRLDDASLADLVEREHPEFEDIIRSAVNFLGLESAPSESENFLRRAVIAEAGSRAREVGGVRVIDRRILRRATTLGAGALIVVLALFAIAPTGTAAIWFQRTVLLSDEVDWPYRTRLVVEGFDGGSRGVPRGDPLDIRVRVEGEYPDRAWMHLQFDSDERRHPLAYGELDVLRYTHAEVREEFRFHVRGGDFRSGEYRVHILERPRLEHIQITRHYPEYIGAPPDTTRKIDGDISVPFGTRLAIEARSSKPLARASLLMASGPVAFQVDANDAQLLRGEVSPNETESVVFDYTDVEGVRPESPSRIRLRVVPDREPELKLRVSGIGTMVSPQARIPYHVQATDDYRIDGIQLRHSHRSVTADEEAADGNVETAPEGALDLAITPESEVSVSGVFDVAALNIEPDASLTLHASAVDSDALLGPKTGLSTPLDFMVVSPRKLMEDFLRRQEEQRRNFERLLEVERGIRDGLYGAMDGGLAATGDIEEDLANELRSHARRERSMSTQVVGIRKALQNILEEMKNNSVGEADDLERIAGRVVDPLDTLATERLPELARQFEALENAEAGAPRMQSALSLSEDLESTIDLMDEILANMVKLEGFTEIVNRLRSIIKLTGESADVAREAYEKMLEAIFDEE